MAAVLRALGRHPVLVHRDIPGFIGNRLQHAMKREAIALVAAGVCDAETIDDVVKQGFGARLGVLGPMEQSDLVGLDLTKNIHDTLMPDLDDAAHASLSGSAGRQGRARHENGQGISRLDPGQADAVRDRLRRALVEAARRR